MKSGPSKSPVQNGDNYFRKSASKNQMTGKLSALLSLKLFFRGKNIFYMTMENSFYKLPQHKTVNKPLKFRSIYDVVNGCLQSFCN